MSDKPLHYIRSIEDIMYEKDRLKRKLRKKEKKIKNGIEELQMSTSIKGPLPFVLELAGLNGNVVSSLSSVAFNLGKKLTGSKFLKNTIMAIFKKKYTPFLIGAVAGSIILYYFFEKRKKERYVKETYRPEPRKQRYTADYDDVIF